MSETPAPLPAALDALFTGLDEPGRAARTALIHELLAAGHPPDELVAAHAENRLALLPVLDILREDGGRTVADIAAEYDVSVDDLVRTRRAMGLAVALDDPVHGPSLERHASRLRDVLAVGLDIDSLLSFNYVIGAALATVASGARDSVLTVLGTVDPDGSEHTRAVQAAELAQAMSPLLTEIVSVTLEEHIRQIARREVTATLVDGDSAPLTDVAVAFADLVGFTALGDSMTPDRLGAGVMFTGRVADDVLTTVDRLAAGATAGGLPELHVGIAFGPALSRAGDWYGSVVNRASRLASLASPATILVDDDTHGRLSDDDTGWSERGPLEVRGLAHPVRSWSRATAT